ncbi:MAG: hypothetical protein Kow00104_02500 [Rhodothalassiaceae bacterium]
MSTQRRPVLIYDLERGEALEAKEIAPRAVAGIAAGVAIGLLMWAGIACLVIFWGFAAVLGLLFWAGVIGVAIWSSACVHKHLAFWIDWLRARLPEDMR